MPPVELAELIDLFLAGQYEALIERHMADEQYDFHRLQLVLISLIRAGHAAFARRMASSLLDDWPGGIWERDLLRVSIADLEEPVDILRRALAPEQVCQAHYYLGEFFLAARKEEVAQKAFRLAVDSLGDCLEARLARARLENAGAGGAELDLAELRQRLTRATREGKQLADRGEHARSLTVLREALELARAHLASDGVEVGILYRQIGETWLSWERWAEARAELERALAILRPHLDERPEMLTGIMNNLGTACQQLRDFTAARALYRAVIEQREATVGLDHPDTVLSLDNLAYLEQEADNLTESRRLTQEVLRRRRRSVGDGHPSTLDALGNLATVLELEGDTASAATLRAEMARLEAAAGEVPSREEADERSWHLAELGKKSLDRGDFRDAQSWYEQALETRRLACPGDDAGTATLIANLGYAYWAHGEHVPAEQFAREALELRRRLLLADHPDIALSGNNLAQALLSQGKLAEVETLMLEALRIDRAAFGEEGDAVAGDLHNLALLYTKTGRPAEARRHYRQAIDLWRLRYPGGHPHLLAAMQNLSNLMVQSNDLDEVVVVTEEQVALAEKLLGNDHPELLPHLGQMVTLLRLQGRFDDAARILDRALAIGRRRLPPGHRWLASMQTDLGILHASRGDHATAVKVFSEAWQRRGPNADAEGTSGPIASNLAWSYGCLDEFDQAAQWARQAIAAQEEANDPLELAHSWGHLGLAEAASGRSREALAALLESARLFDEAFDQRLDGSTDRQRDAMLEFGRKQWDHILSLLAPSLLDDPACVRAVADLIVRRKGLSTALLELQTSAIHEAEHPDARALAEELRALRASIARETQIDSCAWGSPADVRLWQQRARLLEERLVAMLPSLAEKRAESITTLEQLAAALPEGAALVEFVHFKVFDFRDWHHSKTLVEQLFGRHRYLALVIRRGSSEVRALDLGSGQSVDQLVIRWRIEITGEVLLDPVLRRLVATARATEGPVDTGAALREAILDPILSAVQDDRRLILAPDGMLALIPFAALPLPDGRLLMDEVALTNVPVGRDVLKFGRSSLVPPGDPVIVADPDFTLRDPERELPERVVEALEESPSHPIVPLPGTGIEAKAVGSLLGVAPWLGADALKARVLAVRSPRVLHLATHGFLQAGAGIDARLYAAMGRGPADANPLLASGLLLAGAGWKAGRFQPPEEAGDGILTAFEAAAMDLRGTRLVVLSACETGLGIQRRGDGLLGLRRSFLVAGARALVSSLWKVPDVATAELMTAFYTRLAKGDACGVALAEAQREMRWRYPHETVAWGRSSVTGTPGAWHDEGTASQATRP